MTIRNGTALAKTVGLKHVPTSDLRPGDVVLDVYLDGNGIIGLAPGRNVRMESNARPVVVVCIDKEFILFNIDEVPRYKNMKLLTRQGARCSERSST